VLLALKASKEFRGFRVSLAQLVLLALKASKVYKEFRG
jgi:hypothetical protein